jgi:hypothetical protein
MKNLFGLIISILIGGTILKIINIISEIDINTFNYYFQFLFLFIIIVFGLSMVISLFIFTFFLINCFTILIKKGVEFYDNRISS